jgi:hypothetical protein
MADFLLLATHGTVLVTDTTFLDGSWEDALAMTAQVHPLVATLIWVIIYLTHKPPTATFVVT